MLRRRIGRAAAALLGLGVLASAAQALPHPFSHYPGPPFRPPANHGRHSYCLPLVYSIGTFCHPRSIDQYPPGECCVMPPAQAGSGQPGTAQPGTGQPGYRPPATGKGPEGLPPPSPLPR
ncbi:MAG TPA: hypothetical protein VFA26_08695 [Gemmataceae bacterium]|nr:hypothetical protein [Gemmataceae bacterium]